MSAVVCGKRSYFEEVESASSSPTSPPSYKKLRCSSATSPVRFAYSPPAHPSPLDQLKVMFPDMETQLLAKVLEESSFDLNSAIDSLNKLRLEHVEKCTTDLAPEDNTMGPGPVQEPQPQNNLSVDGAEWVDLLVNEMSSATSIDDAKSRAARVLENLEKSIRVQSSVQAAEGFHKENVMLKGQIEALLKDNAILKRAVSIQHERQKEYDEKNQEALQLKQLVAQYQEQLRTLEVNNYALTLHLRQAQAQQSNSIRGRFNPDVF